MIKHENDLLYMQDSIDKQLQIAFDGGTITNKEIPSEQFSLTESLSSDGLMFGSCEASEVKFRIYNVFTPLKDKWLTVTQVLDKDFENPLQIGKYKVYSDKPTADRSYRDVVAYDSMFDIINADVASWYNSLTFPMQLKTFRDSFFDYFGIDQEEVALVNDAMTIEKTIEPSVLSGKDVLQSICQINGCFGHIGRDGKMQYVFLNAIIGGLYPSNNIYPANDLYPQQPNINVLSKGLYVEPPTYEDYMVKPIDKLEIREKEGDIGVIVGSGNNAYVVEDNFLVYGKSTDDLTVIANNMLSVIDGLEYRPFDARLVGNPCFEVGDMVRLNTKHQIIDSYVLQRTLSGVQCLRDDFSADGEEYQSEKVNDIHTDIKQLKGKSNTLERTIEETRSTIANMEEGLQSEISQTADAIRLEVSDNTGKISTIEQTVDSITQRVEDVNQGLSAEIETNANQIVLGVNSQGKMVLVELSADRNTGTAFSVKADNIDLTAEEVISLMSNGNLDLSGKNITISSDNLIVDENGLRIIGGSIEGADISATDTFKMLCHHNANPIYDTYETIISTIRRSSVSTGFVGEGTIVMIGGGYATAFYAPPFVLINNNLENLIYCVNNPSMGIIDYFTMSKKSDGTKYIHTQTTFGSYGITIWESDTKLKKNIQETEQTALDKINKLDFIQFDWKKNGNHVDLGLSANQVEEIIPNAVFEVEQGENSEYETLKNIDNSTLTTYSLKAIQEMAQTIETQQQEIEELKKSVSFLMSKLGDDSNG